MATPEQKKAQAIDPRWGDPQSMLSMPRFESTWTGIEVEVSVTADSSDNNSYVVKEWRTSSTNLSSLNNWEPPAGTTPGFTSSSFTGKNGLSHTYATTQPPVLNTYYAYRAKLYKGSTLVLQTLDTYQWVSEKQGNKTVLKFNKV